MRSKLDKLASENVNSGNVNSSKKSEQESEREQKKAEQLIVTPEEYFEAAYGEADGYIVLCTITQPTTEAERGRLDVQGTYSHDSISNLLSDVNELNGKVHIYTNIHPLREPHSKGVEKNATS